MQKKKWNPIFIFIYLFIFFSSLVAECLPITRYWANWEWNGYLCQACFPSRLRSWQNTSHSPDAILGDYLKQTSYIYIFFIIFVTFFSLILNFWKSNLYSRFLIFAFWYLLSILYLWEPNLQYPILLGCEITGLTTLTRFGLSFFSTRSPLAPPSPFSSLPNYVNLFVSSVWWRTLRELITGWICLSPFDSPLYPPGQLCLLPPSSLLCITPWTSLSGPDWGAHIRKWLLASLLSPLLIPPHLILVTSISLLPLLFSM